MSGRAMTLKVAALARAVAATPAAVVDLALTTTPTMRGATLAVVLAVVLAVAVATMVTTMGTTATSMQEQVLLQVSGHSSFCALSLCLQFMLIQDLVSVLYQHRPVHDSGSQCNNRAVTFCRVVLLVRFVHGCISL